ncbi:MAG: Lrp/AsnC family transcriptional regulator [Candidatus Helarchaeota archaeon]|nr:Lrp/AsnC family transcriptional regulator [Candidatus Helarchaeota archaeon]
MKLDKLNLQILKEISSGIGLTVDYGLLSEKLGKHRSTIKRRIDDLFKNKIIMPPIYFPFGLITKEYPLFVLVFADLPESAKDWLLSDNNIFAAFKIIEGDHNTLIFEYHKTVLSYQIWRENLVKQNKIPSREHRHASTSYYFSNNLIEKYEPNAIIGHLEEEFRKNKKILINNYEIDFVGFNILKNLLLKGNYLKINKNMLSQKLGIHRKTIELRIKKLKKLKLIDYPSCYFSNFFAPPTYYLILTFLEIEAKLEEIIADLKNDYNIPIIYKISAGKYNLSIISSHPSIDDFFYWNLKYKNKFNSIKSQRNVYLSPNMKIFLNQNKIIDGLIEKEMKLLEMEK